LKEQTLNVDKNGNKEDADQDRSADQSAFMQDLLRRVG
jgi:hypothetical protein